MAISLLIIASCFLAALLSGRLSLNLPAWRRPLLVGVALALQGFFVAFPPAWMTADRATVIYLGTQALVGAFLFLNRSIAGAGLLAVGLGLNVLVVGANGAMPVSAAAIESAGAEAMSHFRHIDHGVHLRNEPMDATTRLAPLADVIPVRPLGKVVSPGDLVIVLGLIAMTASCVGRPARFATGSALSEGRA